MRASRTMSGHHHHHHSPRHIAQSPATTRGGRDLSPPSLAHGQRTAYYVESSDDDEHARLDVTRTGVFDTVHRHLDIDHTDRVDSGQGTKFAQYSLVRKPARQEPAQ